VSAGLLCGLLAVVLWGGSYAALKALQATIPPLPLAAVRCLIALAPLGLALALERRPRTRPGPADWGRLAVLGLAGNTLFQLGLVGSLHFTSPAHVALIVTLSPLVATLLAWAGLGERIRAAQVAGMLLAVAGVALIVTRGGPAGPGALLGDLLAAGAAVAWAVYSALGRPVVARYGALPVTFWTMAAGTLGLLPIGLPGTLAVPWGALGAVEWGLLAYLSVLTLAVANLCWYRALADLTTARVVVLGHLTPVIATTIAVAAGQERLTGPLALGAAAVLAGVFLAQRG
jgi:drug/metabolite transporter (DMT)-like permease